MCTEWQNPPSPCSKKNNAKMWHFKNANDSGISTELSSLLLSPKVVCTLQYNVSDCPDIQMWCVEGGSWACRGATACTHFFFSEDIPQLAAELSIINMTTFLPWCYWVKCKHPFMWWEHEIYNLGSQGHKKLPKSLIKACKESRYWDCGSWIRSEF